MHPVDERRLVVPGEVVEPRDDPIAALEHFPGCFCEAGLIPVDERKRVVSQAEQKGESGEKQTQLGAGGTQRGRPRDLPGGGGIHNRGQKKKGSERIILEQVPDRGLYWAGMSNPLHSSTQENTTQYRSRRSGLVALCWTGAALGLLWAAFLADSGIVELVRVHASGWSRWLAGRVSYWGDWYGVVAIGVLIWLAGRRQGREAVRRLVLVMGLCAAVSGISANVIRAVSGRARPFTEAAPGWYGPGPGLKVWSRGARDYQSFPSAHTSVVSGFFAPLALVALRSRRRRLRVFGVIAAFGGTSLMAWARVWAGAHHLSDVLAASMLGLVTGMILLRKGSRFRGFAFLPESG